MLSKYFIERPVLSNVIACVMMLLGAVAIRTLPITQFPSITPPTVVVTAYYPGASAQTVIDKVALPIELQVNGVEGMLYMASTSNNNGNYSLTISFKIGTDPDSAQVLVQNRVSAAIAQLPSAVQTQGVVTESKSTAILQIIALESDNNRYDALFLNNYATLNLQNELARIDGVGGVTVFGVGQYSMRIWLNPVQMQARSLVPSDVVNSLKEQNAEVTSGQVGAPPAGQDQAFQLTVNSNGELNTVEEFEEIIVKSNTQNGGQITRLRDIARVELGAVSYTQFSEYNNKPTGGLAIYQLPGSNALATAKRVKAKMDELSKEFPEGLHYSVPLDNTIFVQESVREVFKTLVEAGLLVLLVIVIFLQDWRATLVPATTVPVTIIGAFAGMAALGFTINTLTLFAIVLSIGIVVDDAIVVVENVERLMREESLSPKEATIKAMGQITGAIIGITVVLMSVFIPMAFFAGSVGNIYRQFSLSMVSAMGFSAFMALSLTPAMCATLLKPYDPKHEHHKGPWGWFNHGFARTAKGYEGLVARILKRAARFLLVYAVIIGVVAFLYLKLPSSFLPNEDQGYLLVNIQLPPGATAQRTEAVVKQVEGFMLKQPEVAKMVGVIGFSFAGAGQNAALAFVTLKDWDERKGKEHSAQAVAGRAFGALMGVRDGFIFPLSPPAIPELGTATGFNFRLQDRGGLGREALLGARNQLLGMASQSKVLAGVRPDGLEDAPQLQLDVDRDRALAQGVSLDAVSAVLATEMGSAYINDFPNAGRLQRVVVQAEGAARRTPEDLLALYVPNAKGQQVPLSSFATTRWVTGPVQTVRYNGYPAMKIAGDAAPGKSTGEAMTEMEKLAAQLPPGIGFEWTGQSREEKLSGAQAGILLAFSLLAVFLCLAALYESWSIPIAILLVVPLGVVGSLLGVTLRDMPNDVFFKVGLITIIGLSAKNAILIVEFAKDLQAEGLSLIEATLTACHLRFRPIVMTSFAFILGVLPLAISTGPGSASQRAIGTGVMGGMITATGLAVLLVPVFYVVLRKLFPGGHATALHPHTSIVGGPKKADPDAAIEEGRS